MEYASVQCVPHPARWRRGRIYGNFPMHVTYFQMVRGPRMTQCSVQRVRFEGMAGEKEHGTRWL